MVYDLETGGLSSKYNSITEFAAVVIDLEKLEIIDEMSVMFKPYIDLSHVEFEGIKEAKVLFKNLAEKDAETNVKSLRYKGDLITLKSLTEFAEDLEEFNLNYLSAKTEESGAILYEEDIDRLMGDASLYKDVMKIYFDHAYHPQALEVTHIPKELLKKEGVAYDVGFDMILAFFKKHTMGNSKPILAGHKIKTFDNAFTEILFEDNGHDLYKYINDLIIDTLEWARMRWWELANYTLGTCASEVGLTLKEAHRALPDTRINAKLLIKMLQGLRGQGNQIRKYVRKKYKQNY